MCCCVDVMNNYVSFEVFNLITDLTAEKYCQNS